MKEFISTIFLVSSLTTSFASLLGSATRIDFDDLPTPALGGTVLPNGYAGLTWANMFYLDSLNNNLGPSGSGYQNAVYTRPNVAAMSVDNQPAVISGPSFHFYYAYMTAAWRDGLNVRVRGYAPSTTRGVLGVLLYDRTVTVDTSGPKVFEFNYFGIATLRFDTSGGVASVYGDGGKHFAIDGIFIAPGGTPIAQNLSVVAPSNVSIPIVLQGSDPKGLPLTFTISVPPSHGILSGTPLNLTYSSFQDFVGSDVLNYQVSNGTLTSPAAGVSITVKHGLFINNVSLAEGNSGTKAATFTVTMTAPGSELDLVTASYRTADGTARAGSDYLAASGTLIFSENTTRTITVPIIGDTFVEPNETFLVQLFNASANAIIVNGIGRGTIGNDDFFQLVSVGTAALSPENSVVGVGEPVNLSLTWTHPVGWRHLDTVDVLIVDDQGEILPVRWHEAENSFSLFNPAADSYVRTAEAGSPTRFETSGATLDLQECTGGGPPGHTATIDLGLSFKPQAAGRTFSVEAFATDDAGNQQGFESVGTITVLPR